MQTASQRRVLCTYRLRVLVHIWAFGLPVEFLNLGNGSGLRTEDRVHSVCV